MATDKMDPLPHLRQLAELAHDTDVERRHDLLRGITDVFLTAPSIYSAGQKGQFGQSNYSTAKAGVFGFTKAVAQENAAKGITVNAIAPGYIGTEMVRAVPEEVLNSKILPLIPVGRLGDPEEIARGVVFLAAEEAGFITGATISANGGQYMA